MGGSLPGWIQRDRPLAPLTTLAVGGPADFFCRAVDRDEIERGWSWARRHGIPVFLLGAGSNVLFDDRGFRGLVIADCSRGRRRDGAVVEVAGGEVLSEVIRWLNRHGLGGMERMYGIPGSVAGAVVGNAGAYGQEICQRIVSVQVVAAGRFRTLEADDLDFGYRDSLFKRRPDWFLTRCRLHLEPGQRNLQAMSDSILEKRQRKYPPGLRCPGSFFKNVLHDVLDESVRERIPARFIRHGKIPAGMLLEAVGARGASMGGAAIASYHGNLIFNRGGASAGDILALAKRYATRVQRRFDIRLEPEIRIVPDRVPLPDGGEA